MNVPGLCRMSQTSELKIQQIFVPIDRLGMSIVHPCCWQRRCSVRKLVVDD